MTDAESITVCVEALDYGTEPWQNIPIEAGKIRREAALILGRLDPVRRDPKVFDRLARLMQNDADPEVRDAAYRAILALAQVPPSDGE